MKKPIGTAAARKKADQRELIRAECQPVDVRQNPFIEPPVVGFGQETLA